MAFWRNWIRRENRPNGLTDDERETVRRVGIVLRTTLRNLDNQRGAEFDKHIPVDTILPRRRNAIKMLIREVDACATECELIVAGQPSGAAVVAATCQQRPGFGFDTTGPQSE